jgi:hypothetical protein
MISFYYVNWSVRFDRDWFDDNCHRDDKLTKFSTHEVFICVMKNMIWWAQIDVNSTQSKHFSCMFSADVLQSSSSLKTRRLIDDVQDEIIINVHDVHYYWIVEIDVIISQDKFETFREFIMFLTKGTEFDQFFQYWFFRFVVESL